MRMREEREEVKREGSKEEPVRVGGFCGGSLQGFLFRAGELYAHALHDFLCDVILETQEVVALQIEAASPARGTVINQLH